MSHFTTISAPNQENPQEVGRVRKRDMNFSHFRPIRVIQEMDLQA